MAVALFLVVLYCVMYFLYDTVPRWWNKKSNNWSNKNYYEEYTGWEAEDE